MAQRADQTFVLDADTRAFEAAIHAASESTKGFGSVFTSTMRQAVLSGKNLDETLRAMAMRLSTLALNSAFRPIEKTISGAVDSLISSLLTPQGFAKGGAFTPGGTLTTFARGGIVGSPALFGHRGGAGLMGEAGPEAILPLARGADGRLGVAAPGSAGQAVSIVLNVETRDAESFRRSEGQLTAMLARAAQRGARRL